MKRIIFLFFLFLSNLIYGQKEFNNCWITGSGISHTIRFQNPAPYIRIFDSNFNYRFLDGSSCISDSNGYLKIISNGFQVYDTLGIHLENGDSLVPNKLYAKYSGKSNYSQSSIILPISEEIYYLITPTASDQQIENWNNNISAHFDLLLYHKIDMSQGPNGKVIQKAIPLLENVKLSKTQMMAVKHGSGVGWWLIKKASDTNMVYKFMVTKDSIYNMGMQGFSEPHFGIYDLAGQLMFNQEGTQLATTSANYTNNFVYTADFDRCNGILSNPKVYNMPDLLKAPPTDMNLDKTTDGICFSPNGRFLYVVKYFNILQLDLNDPDSTTAWYHVANLDTSLNVFQGYGNPYIGPDGKVYISNWNALGYQMSVINNPDVKGSACNFCPRCLRFPLPGVSDIPCMPNYALGKDSSTTCWPLGLVSNQKEQVGFKCYPNPTSTLLTMEFITARQEAVAIEMYNMVGEIVLKTDIQSQTKVQINISSLPKGVYVIRCEGVSQKVVVD